jgi:hypothetical protein
LKGIHVIETHIYTTKQKYKNISIQQYIYTTTQQKFVYTTTQTARELIFPKDEFCYLAFQMATSIKFFFTGRILWLQKFPEKLFDCLLVSFFGISEYSVLFSSSKLEQFLYSSEERKKSSGFFLRKFPKKIKKVSTLPSEMIV